MPPKPKKKMALVGAKRTKELSEALVTDPESEVPRPLPRRRGRPRKQSNRAVELPQRSRRLGGPPLSKTVISDSDELLDDGGQEEIEESANAKQKTGRKVPINAPAHKSKIPSADEGDDLSDEQSIQEETDGELSEHTPPAKKGKPRSKGGKRKATADDSYESDSFHSDADNVITARKTKLMRPTKMGKQPELSNDDDSASDLESASTEWAEDDQILLECTHEYELTLWTKAELIFNCAPFDLFPKGIKAASDHWEGYLYKGRHIKNDTSLAIPFCKSFGTLFCFPYFDGNVEYVRMALSSALSARCGDQCLPIMTGYNHSPIFNSEFDRALKDFNELSDTPMTVDQTILWRTLLESHPKLLPLPLHSKFLSDSIFKKVLRKARTVKLKGDALHLLPSDIRNIISA